MAKANEIQEEREIEEKRRIERLCTLWNMTTENNAKENLLNGLLQYAYDLLWDGDDKGCDAITGFLPEKPVKAMYDCWLDDQVGQTPKSKWHGREQ